MDGLFRLFCGCCGAQGDPEPPYAQLRADSVTPIRDPPIQCPNNVHEQGFSNPIHDYGGYDSTDNVHPQLPPHPPIHDRHGVYSDSPSPPSADLDDDLVEDENQEKEMLDNIVESTQHSIIAVGQTEVDGMVMMDTHNRERAYKAKALKMATVQTTAKAVETAYVFDVDTTQAPIEITTRYDEMSTTIAPSPIDRVPFACPDFTQMKLARPMGVHNPQFLVEHPDIKNAGRTAALPHTIKKGVTETVDDVQAAAIAIKIEYSGELVANMDFL